MTADPTLGAAQAYARELDEARKRFEEALKSHTKKPSRLANFPVRSLTWLALAPTWPTSLAELGFPGESGFVRGTAARENLQQISAARLSDFGTADDGSGELFTMNSAQRSAVLDFLQTLPDEETRSQGVLSYIRKQLTEASRAMLEASERGDVLLTAPLQRWADLAARAKTEDGVALFLKEQIEVALAAARKRKQIVSPEALRWIEAAAPFVNWLGPVMEWGMVQACRRIELFYREAYDDRSLKNYFIRSYQEEVFMQLLPEDPAKQRHRKDTAPHWALHYVGLGGTGKTMLMRRISAQLAEQMNLAVARIDFDRLNPDYPARAPGLLLMGFTEELRLRAGDASADLFERFDKEVEHLHENIKARYDAHNPLSVTIDDTAFQTVLRPFIQALTKLAERKRIVLILDTCEELAKLRSDGSLPDSVRVTFEILERIHERVPSLRVIFAGRRPLAKAGHLLPGKDSKESYNWTCPVSELPARDYLRLYEIRGFTTEESEKFLEQYNGPDGPSVKRELFSAILQQSCSADKTFDSRFEWHDGRVETDTDSRYNPYDLDMFAEWACADSNVGEAEINAGATQYVKDRIMKRLDYHVKSLLPEIVLLGRFDEKMMRQLIEAKGENFEYLFNELISQEWLDVDRNATLSGTVWAVDNIMRKRLYNYYESEEQLMFVKAKRFVADFLYNVTLDRDWKELSPAYFDAAVRVLSHNKKKSAEWWERVEKRLAEAEQWTWAKELTDQLLADDGPVFRADPTLGIRLADESVLRPAVLATQAAAITHLIDSTTGVDGTALLKIWSEVLDKVDRHPDAEGAVKLKHRAVTGKFAALRWHPELCSPSLLDEWGKSFEQLPALTVVDENAAASKVAMLEALVEISEDLTLDPGLTKNDTEKLAQIYHQCYAELPPWLSNLPDDLKVFFTTVGGRLQKLCGLHNEAIESLHKALEQLNLMKGAQSLPQRLDWHRPEDFASRITLECVRALYPAYSEPKFVLTSIQSASGKAGTNTLDADRLASLITQIRRYGGLLQPDTSNDESIKWSISLQNLRPTCSAHRQVPPLFSSLLAAEFSSGRVSQAIERCLEISRQAENSKPPAVFLQKTAERDLLRMAVRSHLRDERGILFGDSLAKAKFELLDDIHLRFHAYALDGPRNTTSLQSYLQPGMDAQRRARLLHIAWRSGKDTGTGNDGFELGRSDVNATFTQFSLGLDLIENRYLSTAGSKKPSDGPATDGLIDLSRQWAEANRHQPVQALTLLLRSFALNSEALPVDDLFDPLVRQIGSLRAAEIALEEGTLLALRMPAKGIVLLTAAHGWYQGCKDTLGQFVATVRTAMLYAAMQRRDELSQSLRTMKSEYEACRVAANVGLPTWELFESLLSESKKATVSDDIQKLLTGLEPLRSWRPLIVRVLGCLIRDREFTSPKTATDALVNWVKSNYSTTISELQQVIPPDISYLFSYKEASVIVKEEPSLFSRIKESTFVRIVRTGALIIFAVAMVITGYGLMARFVQWVLSFVWPVSKGTSLLITIGLIALLSQVAEIWRRVVTLWTRKMLVENVDEVKDPNRPLLSRLKLAMWSGMYAYDVRLATMELKSDDSYRELAEVVPEKVRKKWTKINRWAGNRFVHTKIIVDDNNCAAPWEAIRGLPSEDIWSFQRSRILARRNLKLRDVTRLNKVGLPVQIVTLASSVSQTELAQNSWRMDEARLQPKYFFRALRRAGIGGSAMGLKAMDHTIDKPGEYLRGVFPEFSVVHIIGTPSQTGLGVRLEVQGVEGILDDIYENQESESPTSIHSENRNKSYLLSGEEVARIFPRVRICLVQCGAVNDDSRDSTTRYEAALLRRFGAELFKCGIPAVILLPPLPEHVAVEAIQTLNNIITVEIERGPRRWWHKRTPLVKTVREMQENIARAYGDYEKAIEIAFDVCLYMEDDFDFGVAEPFADQPDWQLPSRSACY
ncbi:MAG TPA: hypothetical protein VJR02_24520 [Pyrinomonadaceae bacterium]|nr:hypothetical protein [Pyrinomonadaceae bacterium]